MSEVAAVASLAAQLDAGLGDLGLAVPSDSRQRLLELVPLLLKWNRTYNLTAIRDESRVVSHHLLDSLVLARYIDAGRVLDVGSGPGFPGLPLAIARPQSHIICLDSNQKKTAFVREAITALQLANCDVVCNRVENWHAPQPFDWIVSRAFSELADFVTGAAHLLAPDGCFAAMKGVHPVEEIKRLPAGFRVREVTRVDVPGVEGERHIVLVERS